LVYFSHSFRQRLDNFRQMQQELATLNNKVDDVRSEFRDNLRNLSHEVDTKIKLAYDNSKNFVSFYMILR